MDHAPSTPFDRVPEPLRAALRDRGFTTLTTVQVAALAAIDSDRDLRISSQTGSGKTVAFGLALAPRLLPEPEPTTDAAAPLPEVPAPGPRALVIVPTRELANQVHQELRWLFAGVRKVQIDSVTGGTHVGQERRRLDRRPAILVGTPGRLLDHLRNGALDCSSVQQLVLDEADQMLDLGFRDELEAILSALPGAGRRTHLLSATFPEAVRELADRFQTDPLQVEGTRLGSANTDITHVAHLVRREQRYAALHNLLLLAAPERTLVFVATRADATTLAEKLAADGFSAQPLSGDLAQRQRTRTLDAFRSGRIDVLVATDVAARGLDVPEVACVIHGDLPMDGDVYTHRSGRTGRAGNKGRSVLLTTPNGERRARRLLVSAGVTADWQPPPSAAAVTQALAERSRRRTRATLAAASAPTTGELEFARELLSDGDPADVVARLLANTREFGTCQPMEVEPLQPRRQVAAGQPTGAPRTSPARSAAGSRQFTRFRVNWGFKHGASPKRILAAMCRRGNVASNSIGSIRIEAYTATFDVAADAARDFERHVSRRDARDPQQRVERVRENQRGSAAPRQQTA